MTTSLSLASRACNTTVSSIWSLFKKNSSRRNCDTDNRIVGGYPTVPVIQGSFRTPDAKHRTRASDILSHGFEIKKILAKMASTANVFLGGQERVFFSTSELRCLLTSLSLCCQVLICQWLNWVRPPFYPTLYHNTIISKVLINIYWEAYFTRMR